MKGGRERRSFLGDRCGGGGGGGDRQYRQHSSYDRYRSSSIVKTLKDLF